MAKYLPKWIIVYDTQSENFWAFSAGGSRLPDYYNILAEMSGSVSEVYKVLDKLQNRQLRIYNNDKVPD